MTSNDFKSLATRELDELAPMQTVVPDVLADGARRHRRVRTLRVGLAAAAVGGVIAVGAIGFPAAFDEPGPGQANPLSASNGNASSGSEIHTRAEFDAWAAERFAEGFSDRVSDVRTTGRRHTFAAKVDTQEFTFNFNITKTEGDYSEKELAQILTPTCKAVAPDPCAALPDEHAIAYHGPLDDGGSYAGMEMYLDGRSAAADGIALNFFGKRSGGPVPITNKEILAFVESPEFERIWREYTEHPGWVYKSTIIGITPSASR